MSLEKQSFTRLERAFEYRAENRADCPAAARPPDCPGAWGRGCERLRWSWSSHKKIAWSRCGKSATLPGHTTVSSSGFRYSTSTIFSPKFRTFLFAGKFCEPLYRIAGRLLKSGQQSLVSGT